MSLTRKQAVDDMLGMIMTAWVTTADQDVERIKWENVGSTSVPPSGQDPWARVVLRHSDSRQASLAGADGTRIFRRSGILAVQVFEIIGNGLPGSPDLPKIVVDAFEGETSPGGVWFRNVTINEVGSDGDFFQTNVMIAFEYDEIK